MDVQLEALIAKIKDEGVKAAEDKAAQIIAEAEERASAIVRTAEEEGESLRKRARADAAMAERSGREALRQAGRDLLITVKDEIEGMFGRIIESETAAALDGNLMNEVVVTAVRALAEKEGEGLEVMLPESKLHGLEEGLRLKLNESLLSGVEIKPFKGLQAGFRITKSDGSIFYDFSEVEIAAMLGRYLNPRLSRLLSE